MRPSATKKYSASHVTYPLALDDRSYWSAPLDDWSFWSTTPRRVTYGADFFPFIYIFFIRLLTSLLNVMTSVLVPIIYLYPIIFKSRNSCTWKKIVHIMSTNYCWSNVIDRKITVMQWHCFSCQWHILHKCYWQKITCQWHENICHWPSWKSYWHCSIFNLIIWNITINVY